MECINRFELIIRKSKGKTFPALGKSRHKKKYCFSSFYLFRKQHPLLQIYFTSQFSFVFFLFATKTQENFVYFDLFFYFHFYTWNWFSLHFLLIFLFDFCHSILILWAEGFTYRSFNILFCWQTSMKILSRFGIIFTFRWFLNNSNTTRVFRHNFLFFFLFFFMGRVHKTIKKNKITLHYTKTNI